MAEHGQRLIDANALMEELEAIQDANYMSVCTSEDECRGKRWATGRAINAVKDAPTVPAVEVVRCKDCKHGEMQLSPGCTKEYHCHMGVGGTCFTGDHDPDFYCKYGERRADG